MKSHSHVESIINKISVRVKRAVTIEGERKIRKRKRAVAFGEGVFILRDNAYKATPRKARRRDATAHGLAANCSASKKLW